MGSQAMIRHVDGLWACDVGGVWQWHSSWREASETLAAIRRFRRKVLGIVEPRPSLVRKHVTVTKRCTYGPCKKIQDPASQWGMCSSCDEGAVKSLAMHRGRKNPR